MARSLRVVTPVEWTRRDGAVQVRDVADAAVTAHGVPQTVTRLELTDENPRPLITKSAPPAMPTEVGDRSLTARAAPVSCCVPVRA